MKYRFFTHSQRAWEGMLEAIRGARSSILWESYILLDDTPMHRFVDVLKQKARDGVMVKVIIDSIGAFRADTDTLQRELEKAGAEALIFNRLLPWKNARWFHRSWLTRNHRKVLIVDGRIAFVGGVNVGERFRQWFDLHLRIEGIVVRRLLRAFVHMYKLCGGTDPAMRRIVSDAVPRTLMRRVKASALVHIPWWKQSRLRHYYLRRFQSAKKRITIVTPYFMPHRWFLDGLEQAQRRGVRVEVLLPGTSENRWVKFANLLFACQAARRGVAVYLLKTRRMNHSKAVLIDAEGMVGSSNIDSYSFQHNLETNVVFRRKDMVRRLERIIHRWKERSRRFHYQELHNRPLHRLLERFIFLLRPFL